MPTTTDNPNEQNVNNAMRLVFSEVVAITVLFCHTPLWAQPESAPVPTDGEHYATDSEPDATDDTTTAFDKNGPWNQGVSIEDRQAAKELFLVGNERFRIPLFAKAAEEYAVALAKWKHPAIYFNLALAQLNLGQDLEARESLEQALRYGEEPLGAAQFKEARDRLQELERQLGRIRITCQTPGAEVTLDGVTLFSGPGIQQRWVTAKDHEITARNPGYLAEAQRVTVSSGEVQDVELSLITLSEATRTSRRWARWKPWSAIAAGAVIAAGAGGLHAFSYKNFKGYDERFQEQPCAEGAPSPGCSEEDLGPALNTRLSLARRQQALAVKSYIAGGSVIAAGIALLYLNQPRQVERRFPSSASRRIAVVPIVSSMSGSPLGIQMCMSH